MIRYPEVIRVERLNLANQKAGRPMALSNRYTSPLSIFNPSDQDEKVSDHITKPLQALARIEPAREPEFQAEVREEALQNPPLDAFEINTDVDVENIPVTPPPPAELPLYLRNPGPPPRLPRNPEVKSLGRTSYRFREVQFGYANHRVLLYACAVIGIILLFVIIVLKPQDRKVEISLLADSAGGALNPEPTKKPVYSVIPPLEQFAVVTDVAGFVLEEPRDGAIQVQNLSQFTYIAFQKKSDDGWYQLKGGTGWIKAASVKTFGTEQAAWDFKRTEEAKIKG
jgi:hypothetical protein